MNYRIIAMASSLHFFQMLAALARHWRQIDKMSQLANRARIRGSWPNGESCLSTLAVHLLLLLFRRERDLIWLARSELGPRTNRCPAKPRRPMGEPRAQSRAAARLEGAASRESRNSESLMAGSRGKFSEPRGSAARGLIDSCRLATFASRSRLHRLSERRSDRR